MPGSKRKNASKGVIETVVDEAPVAIAERLQEKPPELRAEQPPAPQTTAETNRFRSWVTDHAAGYERLTDEKAKLLVLKFGNKPDSEVLDKLKEAGFHYQPDYLGQKKVWTRRNDFESRLRLQEIESMVRGPAAEVIPF
jgi:hypothetical protein